MTIPNFDEGWRKIEPRFFGSDVEMLALYHGTEMVRAWVSEEKMPVLPTEPYTVIRATYSEGTQSWDNYAVLFENGNWVDPGTGVLAPVEKIVSFEVLAVPVEVK